MPYFPIQNLSKKLEAYRLGLAYMEAHPDAGYSQAAKRFGFSIDTAHAIWTEAHGPRPKGRKPGVPQPRPSRKAVPRG